VKEARPDVPLIVFAKDAHYALDALADSDYDVIALDWTMDPQAARLLVGDRAVLQGNFDPAGLFSAPKHIHRDVQDMLAGFGPHNHIANLGHGLNPQHDPEHVNVFVDAVHEHSETMRAVGEER